ncbi:MAG: hypothetical protein ACLQI7_04470 [Streptosporangiaceae bacterium]|jgi:hypothetical protein
MAGIGTSPLLPTVRRGGFELNVAPGLANKTPIAGMAGCGSTNYRRLRALALWRAPPALPAVARRSAGRGARISSLTFRGAGQRWQTPAGEECNHDQGDDRLPLQPGAHDRDCGLGDTPSVRDRERARAGAAPDARWTTVQRGPGKDSMAGAVGAGRQPLLTGRPGSGLPTPRQQPGRPLAWLSWPPDPALLTARRYPE